MTLLTKAQLKSLAISFGFLALAAPGIHAQLSEVQLQHRLSASTYQNTEIHLIKAV